MDISKISLSGIQGSMEAATAGAVKWSKEAFTSIGETIKKFSFKTINLSSQNLPPKYHTVKQSLGNVVTSIKNHSSDVIDNVKNFFDKSPTIGEIYRGLGITDVQWKNFPKELRSEIVNIIISTNNEDKSALHKYIQSIRLAYELKLYIENHSEENTKENTEEIKSLHEEVKQNIENLKLEVEREEKLNELLGALTNPSKQNKANAISMVYGGESIEKTFNLNINSKAVNVRTEVIPQVNLGGIPNAPNLKQVSSEFQGETDHATNLWLQNITVGSNPSVSFIRCGNTRGKESAAKEILANALTVTYGNEFLENLKEGTLSEPLELNFSNIQLMTPGKTGLTDKNMPFKQMDMIKSLAKKKSLILEYKGMSIKVKLTEPLLFNFGTNAQHFVPIFKPLVNNSENQVRNNESFKILFGDLKIFGGNKEKQKVGDHYQFDTNSIIGNKLAYSIFDQKTKEQIQNLADQIIDIYGKDKHGIEKNPYALPSRVALLTNLLGYATSYGCKSGKDRTGIMSMELENLTAKVLTDDKPYDPYKLEKTEKQNLQSIYKNGIAIDIAKVNTGNVQNSLKIRQFHGLFTADKERLGIDLSRDFDENLKILENNK